MNISNTKELGRILRAFRKAQNLTQEQLAAQSGVGVRFLRELESGKPGCQIGKALSVLAMLGLEMRVAPRDVFGGSDDGAGSGDGSGDGKRAGLGDGSGEG
jgi:y4mF family transcriptional regulator